MTYASASRVRYILGRAAFEVLAIAQCQELHSDGAAHLAEEAAALAIAADQIGDALEGNDLAAGGLRSALAVAYLDLRSQAARRLRLARYGAPSDYVGLRAQYRSLRASCAS